MHPSSAFDSRYSQFASPLACGPSPMTNPMCSPLTNPMCSPQIGSMSPYGFSGLQSQGISPFNQFPQVDLYGSYGLGGLSQISRACCSPLAQQQQLGGLGNVGGYGVGSIRPETVLLDRILNTRNALAQNISPFNQMNQFNQWNPMMNQGGEFSSFGMNHPHHQMQNAHVVQDLVQDRVRDVGNLGLASDLIDVRNSDKWATGGINPIDCAIDCTVKALLRDQKYNRKTDEVIANLMSHGTHAPKINEHVENLENLAVDMSARGIGRDLMAVKRQQWLGRQQLQGLCTPFAPQLMGQQSGFSGLGCNPLTSMTGLGFGGYGQNAWNPAAGSRNVWQMVA